MGNANDVHIEEEGESLVFSNFNIYIENEKIKVSLSQKIHFKGSVLNQKDNLKHFEYTIGIHVK